MSLQDAGMGPATADREPTASSASIAAAGAVVAGLAALSCCVMPLVFVIVGISGAWIANLTALSPYQPYFIAAAVAAILYGHLSRYRARRVCATGMACARPLPNALVDTGLWTGTAFVALALAANYAAPYIL